MGPTLARLAPLRRPLKALSLYSTGSLRALRPSDVACLGSALPDLETLELNLHSSSQKGSTVVEAVERWALVGSFVNVPRCYLRQPVDKPLSWQSPPLRCVRPRRPRHAGWSTCAACSCTPGSSTPWTSWSPPQWRSSRCVGWLHWASCFFQPPQA